MNELTDLLIANAQPNFDAGYFLGLLSRVTHTSCGATLLGGLIYLRFVLAPNAELGEDDLTTAHGNKRRTWALCVMVCSALLLASGFYNFFSFMKAYENLPKLYHPLFGVKFLLGLGVMFLAALIAGKSNLAKKAQKNMTGMLSLAIVLALSVFVIGAMLRSFRDLPDARIAPAAEIEAAVETQVADEITILK